MSSRSRLDPPSRQALRSREVDLERRVKPYADHLGDGLVQFSFTLPVPYGLAARRAAQELAAKMGFEHPEVVHYQRLTEGYTYFVDVRAVHAHASTTRRSAARASTSST